MSGVPEDVKALVEEAHRQFADSSVRKNLGQIMTELVIADRAARPAVPPEPLAREPTVWCCPMESGKPGERSFIVRFEDAEMGEAVFRDEKEARDFWMSASFNWNCHLLATMPLVAAERQRSRATGEA